MSEKFVNKHCRTSRHKPQGLHFSILLVDDAYIRQLPALSFWINWKKKKRIPGACMMRCLKHYIFEKKKKRNMMRCLKITSSKSGSANRTQSCHTIISIFKVALTAITEINILDLYYFQSHCLWFEVPADKIYRDQGPIQYRIRCLIRSTKVTKTRDRLSKRLYRFEIWQACRQRLSNFKGIGKTLTTDLAPRYFAWSYNMTSYWIGPQASIPLCKFRSNFKFH